MIRAAAPFAAVAAFAAATVSASGSASPRAQDPLERPDSLFAAGAFREAELAYRALTLGRSPPARALARIGQLALMENRLDESREWLVAAASADPSDGDVLAALAEIHYRRDDFETAARLLAGTERGAFARKLESFEGRAPNRIEADGPAQTVLELIVTDPLPVVQLRVNGGEPANFIVDTGAGELILDPEFARSAGAELFGAESGEFAGGTTGDLRHGRIDRVELGHYVVNDVPILLLDTDRFSRATRNLPVHGILGTVLLYHFVATLDYPAERLVLRRRDAAARDELQRLASRPGTIAVPFRLAGDHFIVAQGTANDEVTRLFLVDTGLAGQAFTAPLSTIREAGIELPPDAQRGTGGAGAIDVRPIHIDELTLGEARRTRVPGIYGAFPDGLEWGHGFRIAGIVSHIFFRPWSVTFDFDGMRLLLVEPESR